MRVNLVRIKNNEYDLFFEHRHRLGRMSVTSSKVNVHIGVVLVELLVGQGWTHDPKWVDDLYHPHEFKPVRQNLYGDWNKQDEECRRIAQARFFVIASGGGS